MSLCTRALFISIFLTLGSLAQAAISVPQNLSASDRVEALKILGFGTASKLHSSPYPLGGYSGVEIGVSGETVEIAKLATLGDGAILQNEIFYPTFSFGKGLYSNFDLFFHFTPFVESISLSRFGTMLRWGFFQSDRFPFNLSVLLHAGSSNVDNKIVTTSVGYDIIANFKIWGLSLYGGLGQTYLKGQFIGDGDGTNTNGVTDTGNTEVERIQGDHLLFGVSYELYSFFGTFQADKYIDTTYSFRIGFRF